MYNKPYGYLVVVSLLAGCAGETAVSPPPEDGPLSWVIDTEQDSAAYLYGVGEGRSLAAARDAGLAEIVSKINVIISSEVISAERLSEGRYSSDFHSKISTSVDSIALNSYQQLKKAVSPRGFYVLLRLDRQAFISNRLVELNALDQQMQALMVNYAAAGSLEKHQIHGRLQPKIEAARALLRVLNSLSDSDLSHYERRYLNWSMVFRKNKKSTSFNLEYGDEARFIAAGIEHHLSGQQLPVNTNIAQRINLQLNTTSRERRDGAAYNIELVLQLQLTDEQGGSSSHSYQGQGRSYDSFEAALSQASSSILFKLIRSLTETGEPLL